MRSVCNQRENGRKMRMQTVKRAYMRLRDFFHFICLPSVVCAAYALWRRAIAIGDSQRLHCKTTQKKWWLKWNRLSSLKFISARGVTACDSILSLSAIKITFDSRGTNFTNNQMHSMLVCCVIEKATTAAIPRKFQTNTGSFAAMVWHLYSPNGGYYDLIFYQPLYPFMVVHSVLWHSDLECGKMLAGFFSSLSRSCCPAGDGGAPHATGENNNNNKWKTCEWMIAWLFCEWSSESHRVALEIPWKQ